LQAARTRLNPDRPVPFAGKIELGNDLLGIVGVGAEPEPEGPHELLHRRVDSEYRSYQPAETAAFSRLR